MTKKREKKFNQQHFSYRIDTNSFSEAISAIYKYVCHVVREKMIFPKFSAFHHILSSHLYLLSSLLPHVLLLLSHQKTSK